MHSRLLVNYCNDMLDKSIIEQVTTLFKDLKESYVFKAICDENLEKATEFKSFLSDFCACSANIGLEMEAPQEGKLEFAIWKNNQPTGIKYRGIPSGHEFTSLLLSVFNADGKGKNLPDEALQARIKRLKTPIRLTTYVSLTCTNCPDVVQALNVVALYNEGVTSETVDGGLFQNEVEQLNIQGVPTVFANGQLLHVGRGDLSTLLQEMEDMFGTNEDVEIQPINRNYDVVVAGGGPAGASAAIYSARKGLKVAVVAQRIGGQVKDTVGIENLISVPQTTGEHLAAALRTHLEQYPIDIFDNRKIEHVSLDGKQKVVAVKGGETFTAPAIIIATGASWRKLNVEGEAEHIGRGVAFCPHCDGPFYKGRPVAVIGGGNSGIEAAIDLAGICSHVTVLEFADSLRADTVLQEKANSLENVDIYTNMQTLKVVGDGKKVTGIEVKNRQTEEITTIPLDGIFVQIGLAANSKPFEGLIDMTPRHEIKVDNYCRTSLPGVYAAGDVTDVPYKQIIIAMGEGAKAALSAFDDRVRGVI